MNKLYLLIPVYALFLQPLHSEQVVFGEDDASHSAYEKGWNGGSNGGSGFEPWGLYVTQEEGVESHAGLYVASAEENKDMDEAAIKGKAFGFFANGISFEVATAFRRFAQVIQPQDSFSFIMKTGPFKQKFETDAPEKGAIGLTLRASSIATKPDDYNGESRFEIGVYEGQPNYQIYDGETSHDSGVVVSDEPMSITLTLLTADTYHLELTNLATKKTTKLDNRKLGGAAGGPLESFCIFNRDGETNDAFFNGFQLSKPAQ